MRALLANDPWFMADRLSRLRDATFTVAEIKALEPYVGRGLPAGTAAYLRACFWLRAFGWYEHRRATASRALLHLRRVPSALRVVDWHQMVFDSHRRAGDFAGCRRSFPRLFAATDPEWRAHSLHDFLHEAAARRQWTIYDRWRREWDRLPANQHGCECATNDVSTTDGLRAIAARRFDELPRHLEAAAAVRGCPHLNAGGMRIELVRTMLKRRLHVEACRAYLDKAAQFRVTPELKRLRTLASPRRRSKT